MLGGTVHVNEIDIATWTAARQDATLGNDLNALNAYDVVLKYKGRDGFNYKAEFTTWHVFGHGPLVLAGKVLAAAMTYLVRDYSEC